MKMSFWKLGKAILSQVGEAGGALKYQNQVLALITEKVPDWRQRCYSDSAIAKRINDEIIQDYGYKSADECASYIISAYFPEY